ncbi:MAG: sugar transferase [Halofilum sp. (in: g-proteobacteria)]|nr:sugar transferase [Halofilum sp. (in: g-proteobacteria)]
MHPPTGGSDQMARPVELMLAGLALALLAPLMALIALAVWLERRGPVLYREPRLGRQGQPFAVTKFRTLAARADGRRVVRPDASGPGRLGRVLRAMHLDELPQLVAVVRGDMSLVGPRPERPETWSALAPSLRQRALALRPGLTSPAALRYLCEDSVLIEFADPDRLYREALFPAKLGEDLSYFETRTLYTDLKVLAATIRRAWFARGADADCRQRVRALLLAHDAGRDDDTMETGRA